VELVSENIYLVRNKIFPSNTYLLGHESNATCIVIDPGLDTELLLNAIEHSGLSPIAVISTHGHFDHIGSVVDVQTRYHVPFYLHEADLKLSQSANFFLKVARIDRTIQTPEPDVLMTGKFQDYTIGHFELQARHYPGHSPGSCVIRYRNFLFTGDILYKKGLNPESIPKEDKRLLKLSLIDFFHDYPDDCVVLPGHGKSFKLGEARESNLELKAFMSS
jgi:glyoxylase-like metal-dependent hydrolase (beta-lactamase superfamily II)